MREVKSRGLSCASLGAIAAVSMTLDHAAALFSGTAAVLPLRAAGRMALPVFAFLLSEGMRHTSNERKYLLRLFCFALISELPFDMALYNPRGFDPLHQNVLFTLLFSALAMSAIKRARHPAFSLAAVLLSAAAAELIGSDYGAAGVLMAVMFFILYKSFMAIPLSSAAFCAAQTVNIEKARIYPVNLFALLCIPLLLLYNGRRGGESVRPVVRKWFFYCYYPLHLAVIAALRQLFF